MFFIAGAGEELVTLGRGEFLCPECGCISNYSHNRISTKFSIFFIPLWETSKGPDFVECQSCGSQYEGEILTNEDERESQILKLSDIASEAGQIAVESRNPEEARANYKKALEAFDRSLELQPVSELFSSITNARQVLVDIFPSQLSMNEALGICDEAGKMHGVTDQLPLLLQAQAILEAGLDRHDIGYDNIMSIYTQVVDHVKKGEELARQQKETGSPDC